MSKTGNYHFTKNKDRMKNVIANANIESIVTNNDFILHEQGKQRDFEWKY